MRLACVVALADFTYILATKTGHSKSALRTVELLGRRELIETTNEARYRRAAASRAANWRKDMRNKSNEACAFMPQMPKVVCSSLRRHYATDPACLSVLAIGSVHMICFRMEQE